MLQYPLFKGRNDLKTYIEREKKVVLIFHCHKYFKKKKVKLAVIRFIDYAIIW
jgi:hypothetical protein